MENKPIRLSVCNQKGGVGKSTLTVLLASWLHYIKGLNVFVVDCDYPQWSVNAQRERELNVLESSDYYKLLLVRQFKSLGRKIWPVITSAPITVSGDVAGYLDTTNYPADVILYDLPGTVNAKGVLSLLSDLDYLFVPIKADKTVVESAVSFARLLSQNIITSRQRHLKSLHLFWTMVDRREKTPLYAQYEDAISRLGLSLLTTAVPYRSKFNKELLVDGTGVGRSTLLAAERGFAKEAALDKLADEILTVIGL